MSTPRRAVTVGDWIEAPETAYRYGVGPLCMEVVRVGGRWVEDNTGWIDVEGYDLTNAGERRADRPRLAAVRADAITYRKPVNTPPPSPGHERPSTP